MTQIWRSIVPTWKFVCIWRARGHSLHDDEILWECFHYGDVIMNAMASQITSLTIVYSTVYSDADQRKHQRSASLTFVQWIRWWPVNSLHKGPVTQKMFPFDDVIMLYPASADITLDIHQLTYVFLMVADALVLNRCQAISNCHVQLWLECHMNQSTHHAYFITTVNSSPPSAA